MECPKCGYDRQPEDTHCALCGVDFGLLDRQAAEKKQLKAKQNGQGVKHVGKPALEMDVTDPEKLEDIVPVTTDCPKCGAPRPPAIDECPHCGVIYEKHEQMLVQQKADEEAARIAEEKRFLEEKARIQKEAEEGIKKAKAKREAAARKQAVAKKQPEKEPEKAEAISDGKRNFIAGASDTLRNATSLLKNNLKKIGLISVSVIAVLIVGWGTIVLVKDWQEKNRQERLIAEQKAEQKRLKEEQQRIFQEFHSKKSDLISHFKLLITQRKYGQYASGIKKYDIPQLESELDGVKKYLQEIKLVDKAKWIPANEFEKNYDIYLKLYRMNPANRVYAKKLKTYRKKLANKNYQLANRFLKKKKRVRSDLTEAIAAIDKTIALDGAKKKYKGVRYKLKNAELLFYEGNENLQMAVRNDGLTKGATGGQRKLYVWLKNVGATPYFINVDYFTLVGKNKKRYSYNNCSRELIVNLQPGQETGGFLYFYTSSRPAKLIFSHINAGTISRKFP